jgi:ADP-heptose:LPS heptosyltransferase
MNLTEKMALDCGVKVSRPYLDRYFLPIKNDNYIIIDTRCKNANGEYDYFNDVLDLIKPYLKEANIDIFQIANDKNIKLACDKCFITINKKQENYLISKSKLLVSNENYTLYVASVFNVKSVGLYSLFNPKNTRPIWNQKSQIILESDREGNFPSYGNSKESPKTINFISPYAVAKNILDSLGIKNNLDKFELVHLGKSFHQKIIEIVPDFTSSENFMKERSINLRLDYIKNLNASVFNYWLTNRKVNIITDKDINVNMIAPFKNNIILTTIMMSPKISEKFLKMCKQIGLKLKIFCDCKEMLNEYRFKFLEWDIHKDFEEQGLFKKIKEISKESKFISSKILISKGKQFSCKANYTLNKHLDNSDECVILSEEFEKEIEFFKIYNEREEPTSNTPIA